MGQKLAGLWGRVQGKQQLRQISDRVFNNYAERNEKGLLPLKDLYVATLIVYNDVNKHFPGPHKEPPSPEEVRCIEARFYQTSTTIDRDQFYDLILTWVSKDLRVLFVTKIIISLLAAPTLAGMTKDVGKRVPRIGDAVEKIPTPVIYTAYAIGFVLLQDARVPAAARSID